VIVSVALKPGFIRSDLQRHLTGIQPWIIDKLLYNMESYGAPTQLYAGTAPEGKSLNGKYLIPWGRVGVPRPDTDDPAQQKKLWDLFEEEMAKL